MDGGLDTVGGRWRRQLRIELDGVELLKWSVAYAPPGMTRHK